MIIKISAVLTIPKSVRYSQYISSGMLSGYSDKIPQAKPIQFFFFIISDD